MGKNGIKIYKVVEVIDTSYTAGSEIRVKIGFNETAAIQDKSVCDITTSLNNYKSKPAGKRSIST